jgi:hypothetical protein
MFLKSLCAKAMDAAVASVVLNAKRQNRHVARALTHASASARVVQFDGASLMGAMQAQAHRATKLGDTGHVLFFFQCRHFFPINEIGVYMQAALRQPLTLTDFRLTSVRCSGWSSQRRQLLQFLFGTSGLHLISCP